MAEGGDLSRTVLGASEEIYDYNCSPCEEAGVYKEAHKYCDSCKLFYCKKCLSEHNKFPALRGHLIKDAKSQPKHAGPKKTLHTSVPAAPLEACEHHPEEMIKMYCGEHDIVCCTVCIALDHRECTDIHYILNLAKDIRTSQDYTNYVEEMKRLKTEYEEIKQSIQDEVRIMSKVKTEIIKEINEYKRDLVSRIEELEKKTIEKVNERYKQIADRMNATASDVDELLDRVTSLVQEIDIANEAQLFVRMKGMDARAEEKRMIEKSLQKFEGLSFSLDERLRLALNNANGLATINFPSQILSRKEYDITFDYDKNSSGRDMSILDDDTIVMTCNDILKRFSRLFDELGYISVPGQLRGICKISELKELAVAIRDKQTIQFVRYTAKTMTLSKSFSTGVPCKGVCSRDEYLFVACGGGDMDSVQGHIRQFDMDGNLICVIDTDDSGQRIFTSPRNLALDSDTNNLYISDRYNGIIVLDRNGLTTSHPYNSRLKNGFGICISTRNNIFTSGYDSFSIQQYDENFRYVGTILNFTDVKIVPLCIVFDDKKKQLIVSPIVHDKIYVYDIGC